jgi:signal transduction histidine kinase
MNETFMLKHETGQAREALLAPASHELRTPFSSVMNYIELLLMQTETGQIDIDKFMEHLRRAIENNRRLMWLVNDILDHVQLQGGMLKLKQPAFHLSSLFEKVHLSFDALLKDKGLFYELQIASDVPTEIRGDLYQLQKVLVNVIGNAIKFTTHGGIRVWVSIAPAGDLSIEVMDTGPGIPPEQLPDIFEAFRRAGNYARCKHKGAGLGLAITKQIVMSMGGRISVFSLPGVGSTFKIALPLDEEN